MFLFVGASLSQDSLSSSRQRTPAGSQRELVGPVPGAGAGGAPGAEGDHETVGLKKRVGLVSGIALIIGTMIGECACVWGECVGEEYACRWVWVSVRASVGEECACECG